MARGFSGKTDTELLSYSVTFKNGITSDPESLGLDAGEVTSFGVVQSTYATKLGIAEDPATRTKVATEEKRVARKNLEKSLRFLIDRINGVPTVTDAQKIAIGVPVRKPAEPVGAPETAPVPIVEWVRNRTIGMKFQGAQDDSGSRPDGCESIVVYSYIGTEPVPEDLSKWQAQGSTTSLKAEVTFPLSVPPFTKVWLVAAWQSPRHAAGPLSTPIFTNLGSGVSSQTA